jgi:hemerythrin-like domain-containing protein
MSSTIEVLGQQHQDVLDRLAEVDAGLLAGGALNLAAFTAFLDGEVRAHFTLEEEALFPIMARHLGTGQGPLAVMDAEHAAFRDLLRALQDALADGDTPGQRAAAAEIIDLLRGHIHKEDHVLFPMATHVLSAEEQQEVDRRAAALTRTATTA